MQIYKYLQTIPDSCVRLLEEAVVERIAGLVQRNKFLDSRDCLYFAGVHVSARIRHGDVHAVKLSAGAPMRPILPTAATSL
jgi:hypothetical protein